MPRLPNIGQDKEWGAILNEFLSVSHTPEGGINPNAPGVEEAAAAAVNDAPVVSALYPGTAGEVGQHVTIGPGGPAWLDEPVFNVKHPRFGAKGDGVTDDTAAIQAAIDAAESYRTLNSTQGATVYFPPGIYTINGTLTVKNRGVTLKGAGRLASRIRKINAGNMVELTDAFHLRVESLQFWAEPLAGHVFAIQDHLNWAVFFDVMVLQQNPNKSILWGDDTVTGIPMDYIDNLWMHFDTYHVENATVASFHLRGEAINRNRWTDFRHTYTGNFAFLIESTAAGSYANDNTIDGVNFEVCTGGIIKGLGTQGLVMRDIAIYDLLNDSTENLIHIGTAILPSRQITFDNVRRNGFSLGAGLADVYLQGSLGRTTFINCGGSTYLEVQDNNKGVVSINSNINFASGGVATIIGSDGMTLQPSVTFGSGVTLRTYTTAGRPAASANDPGTMIYDTTLGHPVWSDGTNWTDGSGAVV